MTTDAVWPLISHLCLRDRDDWRGRLRGSKTSPARPRKRDDPSMRAAAATDPSLIINITRQPISWRDAARCRASARSRAVCEARAPFYYFARPPARSFFLSFLRSFVRSLADQAWQSLLIIVIINNCKRGTSEGKRERKKSFIRNNSALVFVLVEAAAHYYATRA